MRVITLENNIVIGIKNVGNDYLLQENELETDLGELGQVQQADGTFITPPPVEIEVKPTLEEQILQLQQDNLILMDAIATMYEDLVLGGTV